LGAETQPAGSTFPDTRPSIPLSADPSDLLLKKLEVAKNDVVTERAEYERIENSVLSRDPSFAALTAGLDDDNQQLADARRSGSEEVTRLSGQYLAAINRVGSIRKIADADPSVVAAKKRLDAAAKAVVAVQLAIDNWASLRPTGLTDAQWDLATQSLDHGRTSAVADDVGRGKFFARDFDTYGTVSPFTIGAVGDFGRSDKELHPFTVAQIISPTDMLVDAYDRDDLAVWIEGYPTDGKTSGAFVGLPGFWLVKGTKTYDTAIGGSKTVFMLDPVDTTGVDRAMDWLARQRK
jgi:hypothetical protein